MTDLTWRDVEALIDILGNVIEISNVHPDVILAVPRGGLIPARLLADRLGVKEIDVVPRNLTPVPNGDYNPGGSVLVVDEVCDSGTSLQFIHACRPYWKTAVLHTKDCTKFQPDYTALRTPNDVWIVYPWERYESTKLQSSKSTVQ